MQPGEALDVAAQVSVTLAGFAGIVVVFRPDSLHQWSDVDKFRLRLLLANSAMPLTWSLFGILLLVIDPPVISIWRWCSTFAVLSALPFLTFNATTGRRILTSEKQVVTKMVYYPVAVVGSAAILLQLINIASWNRFWPFFFAIFVYLVAAVLQFLRLLLLPPHSH